jgi:hypothetical protein
MTQAARVLIVGDSRIFHAALGEALGVEAFKAAPKFEINASNLSNEQEEQLKAAFAG